MRKSNELPELTAVLRRIRLTPQQYFLVAGAALVTLVLIVFTGAAVRVTGSGLGCPDWPNCYEDGRLVAELNSHAWIEFGNRLLTSVVGLSAIAAGLLAFARRPFRRDLAVLGLLLPLGVLGQAVMGLIVPLIVSCLPDVGHAAIFGAEARGELAWVRLCRV